MLEAEFLLYRQAPEVIKTRIYTAKCDVYSYAITVWEIFHNAETPFTGIDNKTIKEKVGAYSQLMNNWLYRIFYDQAFVISSNLACKNNQFSKLSEALADLRSEISPSLRNFSSDSDTKSYKGLLERKS